jgi:hypothetical protein
MKILYKFDKNQWEKEYVGTHASNNSIISWNNNDQAKAQYWDTTTFHHFEYIWWESVKERIC